MQTNAIDGALGVATPKPKSNEDLKSEDFFKILISELRNQDPLEPNKTADMIGQVSQIRSIELNGQLSSTLDNLVRSQKTTGASEMIGKFVAATVNNGTDTPQAVSGVVTAVQFTGDGDATLELDTGETVRASDVEWISSLDEVERRMAEQQVSDAPQGDAGAADTAESSEEQSEKADQAAKHSWLDLNLRL